MFEDKDDTILARWLAGDLTPEELKESYSIKIQKWYNANKGVDVQQEVIQLLD